METESEKPEKLTAKELVFRGKLQKAPLEKKKGLFQGEALQLILNKLGITQDEIKAIGLKSIKHNKQMFQRFHEEIEKSTIDPKDLINELRFFLNKPVTPVTLGESFSTITLPFENPGRWIKLHQEGQSTSGVGDTRITESKDVEFTISFIPSTDGVHHFSIPFWAVGPYILIADDIPCYNRFTRLDAGVSASAHQPKPGMPNSAGDIGGIGSTIFHGEEDEACIMSHILYVETLSFFVSNIVKGLPVSIRVIFIMYVDVSGEGSIGEFDFSFGKGEIYCPEVTISFPSV